MRQRRFFVAICLAVVAASSAMWVHFSQMQQRRPAIPPCRGALTGRTLILAKDLHGFGRVQGLGPLPLNHGEYVLSFDDGPDAATTQRLLSILSERCVSATFFLVGRKARRHPDLVNAIRAYGHGIGSHSFDHANFAHMPLDGIERNLMRGAHAIDIAAYGSARSAATPRMIRLPGGEGVSNIPSPALMAFLKGEGLVLAGYDISPQDWRDDAPGNSFRRLFDARHDRGVIVMHDFAPNTIALLPMVLDELERRKARVVHIRLSGEGLVTLPGQPT